MIIKTKDFKEICSNILTATDSNEISTFTETLELIAKDKVLTLNVTNGEYYAQVTFDLDIDEELHASVNANLFLKLVSAITTENISLEVKDDYLEVKGNGVYKIPFIYEGSSMLELPKIIINNPTLNIKISGDILKSILDYNSKELLRGTISRPVQRMYYVDEKGCLTFTTGACVNSFTLEKPLRILFNNRLVKLFTLFKHDMVDFTLGYDSVDSGDDNIVQTKVQFKTPKITLTAITGCNDELLNSVPVNAIRGRAEFEYPYNIILSTAELKNAVNRLLLFSAGYGSIKNLKPYSTFTLKNNELTIYDSKKDNFELLKITNENTNENEYSMLLDLSDLKAVLDTVSDDYVTLSFGNGQAIVLKRKAISNVIPECRNYN